MRTNKQILKLLSIILTLTILTPGIANASSSITKEETVYVNLNNDGSEIDKLSSIWIHSDSDLDKLTDKSNLKDIVNIKNDQEPDQKGKELIWEVEDSDLYYQGRPDKDLPLQVSIQYYLDDKKVDPQDIIGESGRLKIKIQVENKDKQLVSLKNKKEKTLYTPYLVASLVNLPTDTFSNININSGRLISDGDRQLVSHVFLPGLKDSFDIDQDLDILEDSLEITSDVEDFQMESIMFGATSEFPDIDSLDSAKDLDELIHGLEELSDASKELVKGTEELLDGQKELGLGIEEIAKGSYTLYSGGNQLVDGSNQLKEGVNTAYTASQDLSQGADILSQSADKLGQGFSDLGDGSIEFSQGARDFSQGASQLADRLDSIPSNLAKLEAGMEDLISGTEDIYNGQLALSQGLNQGSAALEEIKSGKEKELEIISNLLAVGEGLSEIANQLENIPAAEPLAEKMAEVLAQQEAGLQGIKGSSNELISALDQLKEGIDEAKSSSDQLGDGSKEVNQGQKEITTNLGKLVQGTSILEDASQELSQASSQLTEGANSIKKNAKLAQSGANQFTTGSKELASGSRDLSKGLGELNQGSLELHQGILQFHQGGKDLYKGGQELQAGSNQLIDGSKELNQGMIEFHEEGIEKIRRKIDKGDLNIEDIIETKDELVKLAEDNYNFSGISPDMDGKLKFVMKTESIKKDDIEEDIFQDDREEKEDKEGFINWIKGILKRED